MRAVLNTGNLRIRKTERQFWDTIQVCLYRRGLARMQASSDMRVLRSPWHLFFHFLSFTPFIHVTCYVHGVCESRSYCALTSYAIAPERQCGVSNSATNTATWNRNACSRRSLVTEDIKTVLLSLLQHREITQPRITHLIVCCVVLSRYLLQVLYRRTYYLLIYTDKYQERKRGEQRQREREKQPSTQLVNHQIKFCSSDTPRCPAKLVSKTFLPVSAPFSPFCSTTKRTLFYSFRAALKSAEENSPS